MYVVCFHSIFSENALIMAQRLGVQFVQNMSPERNDIVIVFGAQEQADKLVVMQQMHNLTYIIIQSEQVESKVFDNKYYMKLLETNPVLDWSRHNVQFLKEHLTSYKVYSFYFYEFLTPSESTLPPSFDERPIDYFFAGCHTPSREFMIKEFQQHNPTAKFEVDYSYNYQNQQDFMNKLKQVKYVINIPFYNNNALETHRIHRALSVGCEVISLPSCDEDMNKRYAPYVHFVSRLTDFTTMLELERRSDYKKMMKDFGAQMVEANLRGILYAEKCIIEKRLEQPPTPPQQPRTPPPTPPQQAEPIPEPIPQPVTTDFSKYLRERKQKNAEAAES
jgi:hypothetical protein